MVLIIRWKITRPWDNNYLEYIIEIYLFFFFFFFFSILFPYITQLHFNKLKFPPKNYSQFEKRTTKPKDFRRWRLLQSLQVFALEAANLSTLHFVCLCCTLIWKRNSHRSVFIFPSYLFFFFFIPLFSFFLLLSSILRATVLRKFERKSGVFPIITSKHRYDPDYS